MKSTDPSQQTKKIDMDTVYRFFAYLEAETKKLEALAAKPPRRYCSLMGQNPSSLRIHMVHIGISLVLKVLNSDRKIFLKHGLKVRVYDWMNEEAIFCMKSVKQAQGLLAILHRVLYPELYPESDSDLYQSGSSRFSSDEEAFDAADYDEVVEGTDLEDDQSDSDEKSGPEIDGGDETETDDEIVPEIPTAL